MPTVATYYQLKDDQVELSGGSLTLSQSIPVTPAGGEGALVTWLAGRAAAPGGNVTYNVTLNGTKLGDYVMEAIQPTIKIPMQEATVSGNVKKGNNVLVFTKTGGAGTLTLSAVMLWHRVNV